MNDKDVGYGLAYVRLSICSMDKNKNLVHDTEINIVPDFNPMFGTVTTYSSDEKAEARAKKVLDEAIKMYEKKGYALRCAPKTIDTDNHNWRRIARVGKNGKPSVCIQVVVDAIAPYFDGWIY